MNWKSSTLLFVGLTTLSCDKKDNLPEKPILDEAFFKIADISEPYREALYDTEKDLIYIISRNEKGKMFSYNYSEFHMAAEGTKEDFFILDYPVAFGEYQGEKELLLGGDKFVYIYNAKTLKLKTRFRVFADSDEQFVASLDFRPPNLIFIGACNTNAAIGDKGTLVFDRTNGKQIDRASNGEQCLRVKTFIKVPETGQIGLFGLGFQTSSAGLTTDVYTSTGKALYSDIKWATYGSSPDILVTNEQVDYFITGSWGAIYKKGDVSYIGTLDGDHYYDFFLNDDGSRIYGIAEPPSIKIFAFPSLELLGTVSLPEEAVNAYAIPETGFIDDGKIILVDISTMDVHMSIMDLPDF